MPLEWFTAIKKANDHYYFLTTALLASREQDALTQINIQMPVFPMNNNINNRLRLHNMGITTGVNYFGAPLSPLDGAFRISLVLSKLQTTFAIGHLISVGQHHCRRRRL